MTTEFKFSLVKQIKYKGVSIMLFTSTNGWFVETSQGLATDYMETKTQALEEVKIIKANIKSETL